MKKYLISTSVLLAIVRMVSAHEARESVPMPPTEGSGKPVNVIRGAAMQAVPLSKAVYMGTIMTTGDEAVDVKIRSLQEERIKKINDINVEYDAKVKAVLGNLKPKIKSEVREEREMKATSSYKENPARDVKPAMRNNNPRDADFEVKGAGTTTVKERGSEPAAFTSPLKGLFSRFFH